MSPVSPPPPAILIAGGIEDFNLTSFADSCSRLGCRVITLLVGNRSSHPALFWDLNSNILTINDQPLDVSAAYIRYDVFAGLANPAPEVAQRTASWYTTLTGWLAGNCHTIRSFNPHLHPLSGNKPWQLQRALEAGLTIPRTIITNQLAQLPEPGDHIVKPVCGGDYCYHLSDALEGLETIDGKSSSPAIIQNRLLNPEFRLYRVGPEVVWFRIESPEIDYRRSQNSAKVIHVPEQDPSVTHQLLALCEILGLDFAAADFKTHPESGRLIFLEVNSGPMTSMFDQASEGALHGTMLHELLNLKLRRR